MSRANIIAVVPEKGAVSVQFALRDGTSRWYRFTGAAAAAFTAGADPRQLSGTEVDGPSASSVPAGGGGEAAPEGTAEIVLDIAELGL